MSKYLQAARALIIYTYFAFVVGCQIVYAQSDINFTNLTTRNGLSSNSVNAILKDKSGLMWFGTEDGLDRFDGTNITVYRHDASDSTSLPANQVLSLYEDLQGRIWVGCGGGGLCYYDRNYNRFARFHGFGSWPSINNLTVRCVGGDQSGNIWVATYGGLRTINSETNRISPNFFAALNQGKANSFITLCIFEDSHGRMWLGTNKGAYLYNAHNRNFVHFEYSENNDKSISDNTVRSITEDQNGRIWFGTQAGLNMLLPDGKSFMRFKHQEGVQGSLSSDIIYALRPAPGNKLWIGTEEGLNIFDVHDFSCTVIKPDPRNNYSMKNKSVRSIFIDQRGIFWLGTFYLYLTLSKAITLIKMA